LCNRKKPVSHLTSAARLACSTTLERTLSLLRALVVSMINTLLLSVVPLGGVVIVFVIWAKPTINRSQLSMDY